MTMRSTRKVVAVAALAAVVAGLGSGHPKTSPLSGMCNQDSEHGSRFGRITDDITDAVMTAARPPSCHRPQEREHAPN
jgi:hypothetical protein